MINKIKKITNTTNFSNSFKITLAAVISVILFSLLGNFTLGFTIALGAFLTYPCDIQSSLRIKIRGILFTSILISLTDLLVSLSYQLGIFFYPIFALFLFFLSMLSVYGQRTTAVSFSALMAAVLSFSHSHEGWDILLYPLLMFLGGIFYLVISLIFYYINPNRYSELQIANCIKLTSKYLELRGDLWKIDADKKKLYKNNCIYK